MLIFCNEFLSVVFFVFPVFLTVLQVIFHSIVYPRPIINHFFKNLIEVYSRNKGIQMGNFIRICDKEIEYRFIIYENVIIPIEMPIRFDFL